MRFLILIGLVLSNTALAGSAISISGAVTPASPLGLVGKCVITNNAGSSSGNFTRTSGTFGSFTAGTGTYTYTTTNGITTASAPASDKPACKFSSLVAGTYKVTFTGTFESSGSGSSHALWGQLYDGTTAYDTAMICKITNGPGSTMACGANTFIGYITYGSTQSNVEIEFRGARSGSVDFNISTGADVYGSGIGGWPFTVTVERIY